MQNSYFFSYFLCKIHIFSYFWHYEFLFFTIPITWHPGVGPAASLTSIGGTKNDSHELVLFIIYAEWIFRITNGHKEILHVRQFSTTSMIVYSAFSSSSCSKFWTCLRVFPKWLRKHSLSLSSLSLVGKKSTILNRSIFSRKEKSMTEDNFSFVQKCITCI